MTTATITCHDVYNYGASLQAFALQQTLVSLGHSNVIIDYKPPYLSNHFSFSSINSVYDRPFVRWAYFAAKFPERVLALRRKRAFDRFTRRYLTLTEHRYCSVDELKECAPKADCYIAGSDQIWNTLFKNGKDAAFYLDFVPEGARRVSYAASFATEKLHCIPQMASDIVSMLGKFDSISVREKSGKALLESLGYKACTVTVDPVFLPDVAIWDKIAEKPSGIGRKRFVLVYDCELGDSLRTAAKSEASAFDAEICSVNMRKAYADINQPYIGPSQFIWLLQNAECVVTNSFHATAFSLIFKRPFWVVPRSENINARMEDLLASTGLSDRMLASDSAPDRPVLEPDFEQATAVLEAQRGKSLEFLKKAIVGKDGRC